MRKLCVILMVVFFAFECFGQQSSQGPVTVSGCVMNINGRFRLTTPGQIYVLKGHQSDLFSYNGMLLEVTGTVDPKSQTPSPGVPIVLHVTRLKKLADSCQ